MAVNLRSFASSLVVISSPLCREMSLICVGWATDRPTSPSMTAGHRGEWRSLGETFRYWTLPAAACAANLYRWWRSCTLSNMPATEVTQVVEMCSVIRLADNDLYTVRNTTNKFSEVLEPWNKKTVLLCVNWQIYDILRFHLFPSPASFFTAS